MLHKHFFYLSFLFVIILSGCNSSSGPEGLLKDYIRDRFSVTQSREKLLSKTAGKLHEKLKLMSDQDFKKFLVSKNYRMSKFKINSKKCYNQQCFLTYTLVYDVLKETRKMFKVEIKKIAELKQINEQWKLVNVSNIKTFYNALEQIDI